MTPKDIIFKTVKEKLEGTGVTKILLEFFVDKDTYNVYYAQSDEKSYKVDIDKNEINFLKKMFLNKILMNIRTQHNKEIKSIILQMNFEKETFDIFYTDVKDNTFNFNLI